MYINAHALLFFALFSQFYVKNYFNKTNKKTKVKDAGTNFKEYRENMEKLSNTGFSKLSAIMDVPGEF